MQQSGEANEYQQKLYRYSMQYICCVSDAVIFITFEIAFQSRADHPQTEYTSTLFCSCDQDLDAMTSIYEIILQDDTHAYQTWTF